MAYIVNAEIPKYCNKCPFGMCKFSKPLSDGTHGYTCNLEVPKKGHSKTTVMTDYDYDIEKPDWCPLRSVPEKDETDTRNKTIDDFKDKINELEKLYKEKYGCEIVEMYSEIVSDIKGWIAEQLKAGVEND